MEFDWELLASWKVILLLIVLLFVSICKIFGQRNIVHLMHILNRDGHGIFSAVRKQSLEGLTNSKGENMNILDVGAGDGANLYLFPKDAQVTSLDINPHMEKQYNKNKIKYPHLHLKQFILESADDMKSIEDSSMDVVVCSLLLCSVPSPDKVLKEINRVLKKGGRFYFFEHVVDRPGTLRRVLQKFMDFTGLHAVIFDGCILSRDTAPKIDAVFPSTTSKFTYFSYDFWNFPFVSLVLYFLRPVIIGEAVKNAK